MITPEDPPSLPEPQASLTHAPGPQHPPSSLVLPRSLCMPGFPASVCRIQHPLRHTAGQLGADSPSSLGLR